jgi:hypothetical protein
MDQVDAVVARLDLLTGQGSGSGENVGVQQEVAEENKSPHKRKRE